MAVQLVSNSTSKHQVISCCDGVDDAATGFLRRIAMFIAWGACPVIFSTDPDKIVSWLSSCWADGLKSRGTFQEGDVIRSDSATVNPWGTGSDDALHHRKAAL